jgi:hypothetical protein
MTVDGTRVTVAQAALRPARRHPTITTRAKSPASSRAETPRSGHSGRRGAGRRGSWLRTSQRAMGGLTPTPPGGRPVALVQHLLRSIRLADSETPLRSPLDHSEVQQVSAHRKASKAVGVADE